MSAIKMSYWAYPGMKAIPVRKSLPDSERVQIIIKTVCKYFGIDPKNLMIKNRKQEIVVCRQVSMYFIKKHTQLTLKTIGRDVFKGLDHTTVIYSIRYISDQLSLKYYNKVKADCRVIARLIKAKGV